MEPSVLQRAGIPACHKLSFLLLHSPLFSPSMRYIYADFDLGIHKQRNTDDVGRTEKWWAVRYSADNPCLSEPWGYTNLSGKQVRHTSERTFKKVLVNSASVNLCLNFKQSKFLLLLFSLLGQVTPEFYKRQR